MKDNKIKMSRSSNTLLVGYYGKKNLGDDALLLASAWANQHILNNQQLTCTASDVIDLPGFKQQKPTLAAEQKFSGHNRLLQYKLAWQSEQVILGGGSVLHSAHDLNIKRLMLKLSSKHSSNAVPEKQHMAVGVGIEGFSDHKAKQACQHFLNECPFVGLRDEQSYQRAKQLAPKANIARTFDLAPALLCHPALIADKKQRDNHLSLSGSEQQQRSGIAINLCSVPTDSLGNINQAAEQQRVLQYANLICKLLDTTEQQITLISLNAEPMLNNNRLNDDSLLEKVKDCVAAKTAAPFLMNRLHLLKYQPDPIHLIRTLSSFQVVIAMRLHAAILSYIINTPVIAINYHHKCSSWCAQIGLPMRYRMSADNADTDKLYGTIIAGLKYGFKPPLLPVKSALQQSLKNWRLTDEQIEYFCDHSAL